MDDAERITFKELKVCDVLCQACERLNWTYPTLIQEKTLPLAFEGHDVIGLAETGSGKTGAFALPIIQSLMDNPQPNYALILTPTRELALQIQEQFTALGSSVGLSSVCLVGGLHMSDQAEQLQAKKVHIIIATPGRFIDHVQKTKGFDELQLRNLRYLVIDEADRMLGMDFELSLDKILRVLPRDRITYMFSATMTEKVGKLQRASLRNPVRVKANRKYQAVSKLSQAYVLIPKKYRDAYLYLILRNAMAIKDLPNSDGKSIQPASSQGAVESTIIFTRTRKESNRVNELLKELQFSSTALNGDMPQAQRLGALNKFKAKGSSILVATDVASRGLDIPHVDLVMNYDLPDEAKTYMHRVGRTARAGRSGQAVTLVTQYSAVQFQAIEDKLGGGEGRYEMPQLWPSLEERNQKKESMIELVSCVEEAQGRATLHLREPTSTRVGKKKQRKRPFSAIATNNK